MQATMQAAHDGSSGEFFKYAGNGYMNAIDMNHEFSFVVTVHGYGIFAVAWPISWLIFITDIQAAGSAFLVFQENYRVLLKIKTTTITAMAAVSM